MGKVKFLGFALLISVFLVLDECHGLVHNPNYHHGFGLKGQGHDNHHNHNGHVPASINDIHSSKREKAFDFTDEIWPDQPKQPNQDVYLYRRMLKLGVELIEKRGEYDEFDLGDLYDGLQDLKKQKGYGHRVIAFLAEYVILPMELTGRKMIGGIVMFFKAIAASRGSIFFVILVYSFCIIVGKFFKSCCKSKDIPTTSGATKNSSPSRLTANPKLASDKISIPIVIVENVPAAKKENMV